jgi:hypothetical protein
MKVFIDTNIILEYFMHREKYEVAEKLLKELHNRDAQMFMSVGAFYTIHFMEHLVIWIIPNCISLGIPTRYQREKHTRLHFTRLPTNFLGQRFL